MKYYNKDGKVVSFTTTSKINDTGCYGNIYRVEEDDNICLKELKDVEPKKPLTIFDDTPTVISEDIFNYFKDFNVPNFCKLYDLLYNKDNKVVAYTMKYYKSAIDNILSMPVEYLVDNFNAIYDAMDRLAKDLVLVVDLHNRNMILTSDNIVLVDFDKYRREDNKLSDGGKGKSYDVMLGINTSALYYAFSKMFNDALSKIGIKTADNVLLVSELFSFGTDPLVLKRRLRGCRNVRDYFY